MNKRYYSYSRIHPLEHRYTIGGSLINAGVDLMGRAVNPDNNRSTAGNILSGASKIAGLIPGIGTAASVVLNAVGEGVDTLWGSNINQAAVDNARATIAGATKNIGDSLTWDTLADNVQDLSSVNMNVGTQGIFSHKVDDEQAKLRYMLDSAIAAANFAKGNIGTLESRKMRGTALADGGSIHIKPSKRGTFTAAASKHGKSVQAFASQVLANKENYSPAMVKKANFARNASKWHAEGGPIFKTDYDMGLTFINNGGTHEQNPYGGVFMGMAPDGQPNQVEEGEVIYNDYVYSNRLSVPKAVRNKYKLRETSFADAIEEYIKKNGVEERNNDPIANRGLEAFASELAMEQEMVKAKKEMKKARQAAFGGPMDTIARLGLVENKFNRLPTNKFAPGGYILYDRAYRGFDDLYSDESPYMKALNYLNDPANAAMRDALIADINAGKYNNTTDNINGFTVTPENWYRLATDYKKGPVHNALINWANQTHANAEAKRAEISIPKGPAVEGISFSPGTLGALHGVHSVGPDGIQDQIAWSPFNNQLSEQTPEERVAAKAAEQEQEEESTYDPAYWWRMAGLGANAAGLLYNIFDPYHPQVVNEARPPRTINPKYLGDYMTFNPYDINYETSQQDANTAALRNALMQSTSPIRNGSLLAADFNANATRGAARRQALEYNDALRKAVTEFNRGTNQFNVQMYMDAAAKNQAARQAYYQDRLRQAQFNSQLDFQHKMMKDQAIGQGLTSIADYLNDMGREDINARMTDAVIKSGVPLNDAMSSMYTDFLDRRTAREKRRAARKKNNKG